MKYKIGDKVLVRKDLEYDKRYSDVRFDKDMEKYRGGQATITRVHEKFQTYEIDLDQGRFMWGDDMFEGLVSGVKKAFSNKTTPATKAMKRVARKYKVGDKVQIREDLRWTYNWNGTGINVTDDMERKAGKTATIKEALQRHRYSIEEDRGSRTWHEDMFEGIVEEKPKKKNMKYKIGDKVIVKKDLKEYSSYGDAVFLPAQTLFRGRIVTIAEDNCVDDVYTIKEDNKTYPWTDEMFEGKSIPIRVGVSKGKVDIKTEGTSQKEVAEMLGCELKEIPQDDAANDPVSHPSHYTDGKIEVIDFIEDKKLGYHLGNACKYISRCQLKYGGKKRIEDLEKAIWYIKRQIEVWRQDDKQKAEQSR